MIEAQLLVRASCALLGLWGLLHALQWWVDLPSWRDGTALGWDLQRLRRSRIARSRAANRLFGEAGLRTLAIALLLISMALLALPFTGATMLLLALFFLIVLALAQRAFADGADKIAMVAASGVCIQSLGLAIESDRLVLAGALWTGGQLTLSYFASGASKVMLAGWRNGTAPQQALTSYSWGQGWIAALVEKPAMRLALAWAIMGFEILFPLALLAPAIWLYAALACMFFLHVMIAIVMGLNTYPWAFLAAYPSVIYVGQWLTAMR